MKDLDECALVSREIVERQDLNLLFDRACYDGFDEREARSAIVASGWDGSSDSLLKIESTEVCSSNQYFQKFAARRDWNVWPEQIITVVARSENNSSWRLTMEFGVFHREDGWFFSLMSPDVNDSVKKENRVWTDLEESNHEYAILLDGEKSGGPYRLDYKGVSLALAIEALQEQGIISAKWVVGKDLLPYKFYDIDLEGVFFESKSEIAPAFYDWVNRHFALTIGEQNVEMDILVLVPPLDSLKIEVSEETEVSEEAKNIDGTNGVLFRGITWNEFGGWLRQKSHLPVFYRGMDNKRYNFFLPLSSAARPVNLAALDDAVELGFSFLNETEGINSIVIEESNQRVDPTREDAQSVVPDA